MTTYTDIDRRHWTLRWAPPALEPYLRLARLDRPVGTWLLLWPGYWAMILAGASLSQLLWLVPAFALGALLMRSAGCVLNDYLDRDIDSQVERTRTRPLAAGDLTGRQALAFMALLMLVALGILLTLKALAIALGVASLALVAVYPLMKRITWWPQAFLGLTFNWGALMGWAAVTGELPLAAVLLWLGGVAWTFGYDTIYALQDMEDDARVGVKSSTLALGSHLRLGVGVAYGLAAAGWTAAAGLVAGWGAVLVMVAAATGLGWQLWRLDPGNRPRALALFKANILFGGGMALTFLAAVRVGTSI